MPEKNRFPAVLTPTISVHGTQDPDIRYDIAHTLGRNSGQENAVCVTGSAMRVRRLMPVEGERLQGFPDGHTDVFWYECCGIQFHYDLGKYGCPNCAGDKVARLKHAKDSPRYKAIGNSWAVYCARWLGWRIDRQLKAANDNNKGAE